MGVAQNEGNSGLEIFQPGLALVLQRNKYFRFSKFMISRLCVYPVFSDASTFGRLAVDTVRLSPYFAVSSSFGVLAFCVHLMTSSILFS